MFILSDMDYTLASMFVTNSVFSGLVDLLSHGETQDRRSPLGSDAGIHWPPVWPGAEFLRFDWLNLSGQQTVFKGKQSKSLLVSPHKDILLYFSVLHTSWKSSDLGSVPVLRLLHVWGGHGFILDPDVPQSSSQVWFGHIQVNMHLLGHDLLL